MVSPNWAIYSNRPAGTVSHNEAVGRIIHQSKGVLRTMQQAALEGVRVLDFTHHVAGPYCTKLLADFGADVVKIERPGCGDPARRMGPFAHDTPNPDMSLPFLYLNTSKCGVTLNLKSRMGREIALQLAAEADVVVENFSPRVMPSLGLDYDAISAVNPDVIMVSVSNFGQTGPYRDYKATEIVEYALGGMAYIFGSQAREPLVHAYNQAQFKAGANAASAAAIAVFQRLMTGRGDYVDVSIQESMVTALRDTASVYTYQGGIKTRAAAYTGEMPRGPLSAGDGYVVPVVFGGVDWADLSEFLGSPALADERFTTAEGRRDNARDLREEVEQGIARHDADELFYAAHKRRGYIFGLVQDPSQVFDNPQYNHRAYFADVEHPVAGSASYPGAPFEMSDTPWRARLPAPTLGQHNAEVFGGLCFSQDDLVTLKATGDI